MPEILGNNRAGGYQQNIEDNINMDDKTVHMALKKLREEISTNKAALKLSFDNPLKASIMLDGLFNLVDPNERIIRIGNKLKELGKK